MANVLLAVVAQRLVRRICDNCVESYVLKDPVLDEAGQVLIPRGTTLKRGEGCMRCHQTGYLGRTGIFEVLEVDDSAFDDFEDSGAGDLDDDGSPASQKLLLVRRELSEIRDLLSAAY